jgi:ABC-type Fe3+-hydroxamate transport system substrate-binding protein
VALATPARRIVSLAPSITELLFAIGAGDRVVGRTTWCKYPPAATAVPSVGDGLDPNVEAIGARRPDLVVLYRSALTESASGRLATLGIPTLVLRHDRLADVGRTARLLGRLTGRPAAGDSVARLIDSTLAGAPPAALRRPRLAFVVWDNPPMTIGGGSFLNELVDLAGGENVFHDIPSASATVSLETIATRDPDWILILSDSAPTRPAWSTRAEWRVVRAVQAGRFLFLPAELFGQPSSRTPEAVVTLRRMLEAAR